MTPQSTGLNNPLITELTPTKAKSGDCGCTGNSASMEMEESILARIAKHPCYSEEAHHHYARMHKDRPKALPVNVFKFKGTLFTYFLLK